MGQTTRRQAQGARHQFKVHNSSLAHRAYGSYVSICARCSAPEKSTEPTLVSEKNSYTAQPPSRCPFPVCFTPPNGMCASAPMVGALIYVIPVSSALIAPITPSQRSD